MRTTVIARVIWAYHEEQIQSLHVKHEKLMNQNKEKTALINKFLITYYYFFQGFNY